MDKEIKERKILELEELDKKVLFNFVTNIDHALIEENVKKIASLTNSFALYVNTLLDIKENRVNE